MKRSMISYNRLCCIFIVMPLLLMISCKKNDVKVTSVTFDGLGTVLNVIYTGEKDDVLESSLKSDVKEIEGNLSYFDGKSLVTEINKNAFEKEVKVPGEVCRLINFSMKMSDVTDGKFDITYKSKGKLWEKNGNKTPSKKELDSLSDLVGTDNIVADCEKGTVRYLKKGVLIDLGGIAKGYAIDRAGKIMKKKGKKDFIINYGGDMLVCGKKGGKHWNIGVKNPDTGGKVLKTIMPKGEKCLGIATSGNYERFRVYEGSVYSHIINPDSGMPANIAKSVTVVGENAVTVDALATAVSSSNLDEQLIKKIVDKFSVKIYTLSDRGSVWKEYEPGK